MKELLFNGQIGQWKRRDVQQCNFKNYDLIYAFYCRFPSWGCPVKLRQCAANKTFFLSLLLTSNSFHTYNPLPSFVNSSSCVTSCFHTLPNLNSLVLNFETLQELLKISQLYLRNVYIVSINDTTHIAQFSDRKFLIQIMVDTFIYCDIVCMFLNLYIKLGFLKLKHSEFSVDRTSYPKDKIRYRSYKTQSNPFSLFYILFILFAPVFKFTDFESPLVLFSWWRNKISWGLLNQLSKLVAQKRNCVWFIFNLWGLGNSYIVDLVRIFLLIWKLYQEFFFWFRVHFSVNGPKEDFNLFFRPARNRSVPRFLDS